MNLLAPLYRCADHLRRRAHGNAGRSGEDRAHRHLRRLGYTVVARNWRPPQGGGEIDIVAWDGDSLVFVEVKYRSSGAFSAPERAVDPDKILALRRAARDYVRRAGAEEVQARFDLICITSDNLEYFRDAFAIA